MKGDWLYCIYRVYTPAQRPDPDQRHVFYAWTESKAAVKAFFLQRSKKKYHVVKLDHEDGIRLFEGTYRFDEMALEYVDLPSVQDPSKKIPFFCTLTELQDTEVKIQKMMREAANLKTDDVNVVIAFTHLHPKYAEALRYIGFRPTEVDDLFASADETDDYSNDSLLMAQIESAYTGGYEYPDQPPPVGRIPGVDAIEDDCKKVIYSLESFVKALKEEL